MPKFLIFLILVMTAHQIQAHDLDPLYYVEHSSIQAGLASEVIRHIQLKGDEHILDIGCGDGRITAFLAKELPKGKMVGIDLSLSMIEHAAKTYLSNEFPNLSFIRQGVEDLSEYEQYDIITCFSCFHWVRDPGQAFDKIAKALKPGGRAYILTYPKESPYWRSFERTLQDPLFADYLDQASTCCSTEEYKELAEKSGLKVVVSKTENRVATHHNVDEVKTYIKGWSSCYIPLPNELEEEFISRSAKDLVEKSHQTKDGTLQLSYTQLTMILEK